MVRRGAIIILDDTVTGEQHGDPFEMTRCAGIVRDRAIVRCVEEDPNDVVRANVVHDRCSVRVNSDPGTPDVVSPFHMKSTHRDPRSVDHYHVTILEPIDNGELAAVSFKCEDRFTTTTS